MKEEWRIVNCNPDYEVSNFGGIRNRTTGRNLKPTFHKRKGRILPTCYLRIELKHPRKKHLLHRLVAEAFIDNPFKLPQINHKDEDGLNNNIANLEWCDNKYNIEYSRAKRVFQYNKMGYFIAEYKSIAEAEAITGASHIGDAVRGKRKTAGKFLWEGERMNILYSSPSHAITKVDYLPLSGIRVPLKK